MTSHLGPTEHEVYRAAIEASPCAMIVADGAGIIAMVNREAERLFGYDAGTLLGQPIEILLPDDCASGTSGSARDMPSSRWRARWGGSGTSGPGTATAAPSRWKSV